MTDVGEFVEAFFDEGNSLDHRDPNVANWIETITPIWPTFPLVLPRMGGGYAPGAVRWYIITSSHRQARRVREELRAWIGPTYSAPWSDAPIVLNVDDPVEAAIERFNGGPTLAIDVTEVHRHQVRHRLSALHALWVERPERSDALERRAGLLLREFHLAIASGTPETAAPPLRELDERGLLSAENRAFLEVVLLEARAEWHALAHYPRLAEIATGRRPWAVTRALITALYRVHLAGAEYADDTSTFVEVALEFEQRFPQLFRTRGPLDRPEVAKAFALLDAGHPERPYRTRARVLDAQGLSPADRAFLEGVLGEAEQPIIPDPLSEASALVARGEFDAAWDRAQEAEPGEQRALLLVQCAVEVATLEAAQEALNAFAALREDRQAELETSSRRFARDVEDLRTTAAVPATSPDGGDETEAFQSDQPVRSPDTPGDHALEDSAWTWTRWFQSLHASGDWSAGPDLADRLRDEAVPEPDTPQLVSLISQDRDARQQRLFLGALPAMIGWTDAIDDEASAASVRQAVLEALSLQDFRGPAVLDAGLHLTERLLQAGFTPQEYASLLEHLELLWAGSVATDTVGWLSEVLTLLADAPAERVQLAEAASRLVQTVRTPGVRLSDAAAEELIEAATAAGAEDAAAGLIERSHPAPIDETTRAGLKGKLVGFYTLTPSVGSRVKTTLERLVPGLTVVVNADHVSTDSLVNLSKSADVMVVMLRSAKHAATDAIERARAADAITLRVGCRGSTRVIEEVLKVAPLVAG